jgi:hypothetical protein
MALDMIQLTRINPNDQIVILNPKWMVFMGPNGSGTSLRVYGNITIDVKESLEEITAMMGADVAKIEPATYCNWCGQEHAGECQGAPAKED